jgi:hypothetical protein
MCRVHRYKINVNNYPVLNVLDMIQPAKAPLTNPDRRGDDNPIDPGQVAGRIEPVACDRNSDKISHDHPNQGTAPKLQRASQF